MSKRIAILLLLAATSVIAGDFELKSAAPLSLAWRGAPLIVAENAEPEFAPKPVVTRVDALIHHVWRADDKSKTRIEVATGEDTFELTLVRLVEADVSGLVRYTFTVPHAFLDGCPAEWIAEPEGKTGKAARKGVATGTLGPRDIKNANLITYLRVHHPAGDLDFDFNPRGWWTGEKTITPHAAEWNMRRTAAGYEFSSAFSRTMAGTLQEFKVVIRRADKRPVSDVHPRVANRWTDGYRNIFRLDKDKIHIERDTLQFRVPRDGWYMVNMLVGATDRPIGPCEVWADETKKRQMPRVAPGERDTWTLVARAVNETITLRLRGDFHLTAVGVTPMLYENEDYLFRRGWWLSSQRHPGDTLPE
ncbi:MAG: hypothetical protein FJ395_15800 [Verrucomicrobia bacterium]|nr:hypothetical protein [Verrucomicrobiota bacterium]